MSTPQVVISTPSPLGSPLLPGLLLLFLVAIRVPGLDDPLLGFHDKRMNDTAAIARNFYELGMNIFYPQIDWGGNGPGYIEEAFQLYAYTVALSYQLFGDLEWLGRTLSLIAYAATGILLYRLACRLFTRRTALFALFFFAVSPMGIYYGRAFQPDSLGLFFSFSAVYLFLLWTDKENKIALVGSMMAVAAAALTKPTNLFVGLPLLYLAHRRFGWRLFWRSSLWAYAAAALVPAALWHWHAYHLGVQYGNTVGIFGGEGFSRFSAPLVPFFKTIAKRLAYDIATLPGLLLLGLGFALRPPRRDYLVLVWTLGFALVLVATAGAQFPHDYYQLPLVPLVALFMGWGADYLWSRPFLADTWFNARWASPRIAVFAVCALVLAGSAWAMRRTYTVSPDLVSTRLAFAHQIQYLTQPGSLIIIGIQSWEPPPGESYVRREPDGLLLGNCPVDLYQSHRKGWTINANRISLDVIRNLQSKGARYFATRFPNELDERSTLRELFIKNFTLLDKTGNWEIYDLTTSTVTPLSPKTN